MNFQDLYEIYKKIIKEEDITQKKAHISNFIAEFINKRKEIKENLSIKKGNLLDENDIKKLKDITDINKYFEYDYDFNKTIETDDEKYIFVKLVNEIYQIINKEYFDDFIRKDKASLPEIDRKINRYISNTSQNIRKKVQEISGKKEITDIQYQKIFNENRDAFKEEIDYLIDSIKKEIANDIKEYTDNLKKFVEKNNNHYQVFIEHFNSKSIDKYLNSFYNKFVKSVKLSLKEKLYKDKDIKNLLEYFNKTDDDIFIPKLEEYDEDYITKYENVETELEKTNPNLKIFEGLFNTKYGDWIVDAKPYPKVKDLKKLYDEKVLKQKPEEFQVKPEFKQLSNFTEKIKEIKRKLEKKEKLQETEITFIDNFDDYIKVIESNPQFSSNKEFLMQVEYVKEFIRNLKIGSKSIKEKVKEEIKEKRVIKDEIKKKEEDSIYLDDYIQLFKIAIKFFAYGGIIFVLIILFISFIGIIILIYDIIINIITIFVNLTNSTKNNSIDYMTKSIIKCSKDNYSNDRFLILTEQKQNLTIFNLGAYTIYLLIIYFIVFFILMFYANRMKYKFIGTIYDIDPNFIYLFMIGILLIYSAIHLLLFKMIFKPFVYIPYYTIQKEETGIDELIAKMILIKNDDNKNLRNDEFFKLLYDASKIDELSDMFLTEIKSKDSAKCLKQKIIIYNLYEYLRQYIDFDEQFQKNFKIYCIRDADNKPKYENGNTITFISMLNNNEVKIITNFHEELPFFNKLDDEYLEFYNQLNKDITENLRDINKKIITHNKTTLPFFLTILGVCLIFLLNFVIVYIIIQIIQKDKTDAYHKYIIYAINFLNDYIYTPLLTIIKKKN